jgi:hypothetical protein
MLRRMRRLNFKAGRRSPRGVIVLGFNDEKDAGTRRMFDQPSAAEAPARPQSTRKKKGSAAPDVGQALRSAYERTVREQIPPDLLDLLGKLG